MKYLILIFSIMSLNAHAEGGFDYQELIERSQQQVFVAEQIKKLEAEISNTKGQINTLKTVGRVLEKFTANELYSLLSNSKKSFPEDCKFNFRLENQTLVVSIEDEKNRHPKYSTNVDEQNPAGLRGRADSGFKITTHDGNFGIQLDSKGTIIEVSVNEWGKGGNSCPYERPLYCPACE